jgi:hypothetical protein
MDDEPGARRGLHHRGLRSALRGASRVRRDRRQTAVLDLRSDPRAGLGEVGLDLDDYPHLEMHVLVREIAAVIRAEYEWVAFLDFDRATYGFADSDEWLYLGSAPVTVEPAV